MQIKQAIKNIVIITLASLLLVGCGSSDSDGVTPNLDFNPQGTGNLQVDFAQARFNLGVPANRVLFRAYKARVFNNDFFDEPGSSLEAIYTFEADFAPSITLVGVPEVCKSLEIIALDASGVPVQRGLVAIAVVPGITTVVDSAGFNPEPIELTALDTLPEAGIRLMVNESRDIALIATYGTTITRALSGNALNEVAIQSGNSGIATSTGSQVTGVSIGNTTLTYTFRGQTVQLDVIVDPMVP